MINIVIFLSYYFLFSCCIFFFLGEAKTDFEAHLPKEEEKNTNNANLTFINTKLTFIFSLILLTVCK